MEVRSESVIERISSLLEEQKKTQKELIDYIGAGKGTFTHWKNDNRKSYFQYIPQISDFLHTTPNYLLLGVAENEDLSPFENEIIQMLRKASLEQQNIIRSTLKNFLHGNNTEK